MTDQADALGVPVGDITAADVLALVGSLRAQLAAALAENAALRTLAAPAPVAEGGVCRCDHTHQAAATFCYVCGCPIAAPGTVQS